MIRLNRLDEAGFVAWDFLPGMRFGERTAWWRDGAGRADPHEGLDLRRFRTRDGSLRALGAGALVPAAWAGEVAAVVDDFLGRTVFVAHDWTDGVGRRLHSVYGHVAPRGGLAAGSRLRDGEELGAVADPGGKSVVPPHLHLTLALVATGPAPLGWDALRDPARATLLDPLPLVAPAGASFFSAQA